MILKRIILLVVVFVTSLLQAQTTYFVDATGGNDSNNGTLPTTAWQTIQKVKNVANTFQAGDSILFKKGEIWNERFNVSNHPSGTNSNPITYTSYGIGVKPIITVHSVQSPTWTDEGSNVWSTITPLGSRYFKNGIEMLRLPPSMDSTNLGLYGTEYYDECHNGCADIKLYLYSTTNPFSDTFSWSPKSSTIMLSEADYINLVGINFIGGSRASIRVENNIGWNIFDCTIGKNAGYGIWLENSSDILIDNCQLDANFDIDQSQLLPGGSGIDYTGCSDGIFVTSGSFDITVSNCFFMNWGHASFSANTDDSTKVISNISFHNNELTAPSNLWGGRIAYSGYSEDGEYFNNYIHNIITANQLGGSRNHFHHNIIDTIRESPLKAGIGTIGISMSNYNIQVKDNIIENNIIANVEAKGMELDYINYEYPGEFSGNFFRNNIIYNCGILDNDIAIQFHKDSIGELIYNNIVENNLIYSSNSTQTCLYQYNGVLSDVAIFNTQDTDINNNIGGDPLFVDIANGNYHLQEDSPAIDAGTTPLSIVDYDGNTIPYAGTLPDIGVYEYQGFLSVDDIQYSEIFTVFPNPTTGTINFSNQFINNNYKLYSINGIVVKSGIIKTNEIDLSKLKTGIYLLKIINNKLNKIENVKIIKE